MLKVNHGTRYHRRHALDPTADRRCQLTRSVLVVHDHAVGGREDDLSLGRHDVARVQGELEPTQQNKQRDLGKTKGGRYQANLHSRCQSRCVCADGTGCEGRSSVSKTKGPRYRANLNSGCLSAQGRFSVAMELSSASGCVCADGAAQDGSTVRRVVSGGSGGTITTRRRTLVSRYAMSMPRHSRGPPWNGMYVKGLGGVRNLGSRTHRARRVERRLQAETPKQAGMKEITAFWSKLMDTSTDSTLR